MIVLLIVLGTIGLAAAGATVAAVVTDGYGAVPTRRI